MLHNNFYIIQHLTRRLQTMKKLLKLSIFLFARSIGLFWLCQFRYRYSVRVLCYHGFSYVDEHLFRPKLFMRPQTFEARLQYLKKSDYQIVTLSAAIANPNRKKQLVLTMDDGWSGTFELVGDMLKKHMFPLTLYVTSYYADKQIPVLNVAVSYLLWKTKQTSLTLSLLGKQTTIALSDRHSADVVNQISKLLDEIPEASARCTALYEIADQLSVGLLQKEKALFRLLSRDELKALTHYNVELQLHTHRHCSPLNPSSFAEEIKLNREWLAQFTPPAQLIHFCYPSGEYQQEHFPLLKSNGIATAVTTHSGLYQPGSDLLQICRVQDGEDVHWLELEAELCGFTTLLRRLIGVSI